jgi:FKBP-type peptidyl-prolyl cis-trans isomerase SlyD
VKIAKNAVVTLEYTLTDPLGHVIDSSRGRGPMAYLHGSGGLIPGFERELEGKAAGEMFNFTVPADQAYGEKDEALIQKLPRNLFQGAPELQEGMQFQAQTPAGRQIITVVGFDDDTVTVDANHPLAGVPLTFDVEVLEVRDATQEELAHGHIHAGGGGGCCGGGGHGGHGGNGGGCCGGNELAEDHDHAHDHHRGGGSCCGGH